MLMLVNVRGCAKFCNGASIGRPAGSIVDEIPRAVSSSASDFTY